MPELPEAERARQTLESALGRRIVGVDDNDTYVCRPHAPGELADALTGHTLATAHRRGKFMWLETDDGPALGLHLGMAGRIVVDPEDTTAWDRFALGERSRVRPRRATERELRVLITHLEASLLEDELPQTELAAAIASHRRLVERRRAERPRGLRKPRQSTNLTLRNTPLSLPSKRKPYHNQNLRRRISPFARLKKSSL